MLHVSKSVQFFLAAYLSVTLIGCSSDHVYQKQSRSAVYGNAESFCLDPVAKQDIYETSFSINLPVSILVPSEEVTAEGIEAARVNAEKTQKGEIGKREPISVVKRGDGYFSVLDGNRSFSYLKSIGARSVPVEITFPFTKDVDSIDELIEKNEAVRDEFYRKVNEIHSALGGELKFRPPKAKARIIEKINKSYRDKIGGVTDILAGRLIFENSEDILKSLDYIKRRNDVISFEDRWNTPLESGYMDVISYIRMSNGVIGELQFSLKAIIDINDLDHKLYEYIRSHEGEVSYQNNDRRVINIKKKIIKLAVEGKGNSLNKFKTQMISIAEKLVKSKKIEEGEKIIDELELLVNKI